MSLYNLEERIDQIHADMQSQEEAEPRPSEDQPASTVVKKKMS
jgi:hypothetical protein